MAHHSADEAALRAEVATLRQRVAELEAVQQQLELAQEALARERHQLRTLIDHLPDYIFIKDRESRFVVNNRAHLQVLGGRSQEEVAGKTDFDIFPRELAERYYADEQAIIQSGQPLINREEQTITPSGEQQWLLTTKVPLRNERGEIIGLVGISRDITERKKAEEALARSNAELEQFAYMVSYEMQKPLRAIVDELRHLEARLDPQHDLLIEEVLARVTEAAQTAHQLSNDLMIYTREGTWGMLFQPVEGEELLRHVLDQLQEPIAESGAVITHDPLPTITGDISQLLVLFENLIANAIQYRGEDAPRIHIGVQRQGDEWLFSVTDNGIGVAAEHLDRIFAIFQRLHDRETYPGTGVGLAICRKVVERHGGRIWATSTPSRGSTFYFTLPVQPPGHRS